MVQTVVGRIVVDAVFNTSGMTAGANKAGDALNTLKTRTAQVTKATNTNTRASRRGLQAFLEIGRGAEDFGAVFGTTGLPGALRASANNLSQFATILHPLAGALVGVTVGVIGITPALLKMGSNAETAAQKTLTLQKSIDKVTNSLSNMLSEMRSVAKIKLDIQAQLNLPEEDTRAGKGLKNLTDKLTELLTKRGQIRGEQAAVSKELGKELGKAIVLDAGAIEAIGAKVIDAADLDETIPFTNIGVKKRRQLAGRVALGFRVEEEKQGTAAFLRENKGIIAGARKFAAEGGLTTEFLRGITEEVPARRGFKDVEIPAIRLGEDVSKKFDEIIKPFDKEMEKSTNEISKLEQGIRLLRRAVKKAEEQLETGPVEAPVPEPLSAKERNDLEKKRVSKALSQLGLQKRILGLEKQDLLSQAKKEGIGLSDLARAGAIPISEITQIEKNVTDALEKRGITRRTPGRAFETGLREGVNEELRRRLRTRLGDTSGDRQFARDGAVAPFLKDSQQAFSAIEKAIRGQTDKESPAEKRLLEISKEHKDIAKQTLDLLKKKKTLDLASF